MHTTTVSIILTFCAAVSVSAMPFNLSSGAPSGSHSGSRTAFPTGIHTGLHGGFPPGFPSSLTSDFPSGFPTNLPSGFPTSLFSDIPTGKSTGAPVEGRPVARFAPGQSESVSSGRGSTHSGTPTFKFPHGKTGHRNGTHPYPTGSHTGKPSAVNHHGSTLTPIPSSGSA